MSHVPIFGYFKRFQYLVCVLQWQQPLGQNWLSFAVFNSLEWFSFKDHLAKAMLAFFFRPYQHAVVVWWHPSFLRFSSSWKCRGRFKKAASICRQRLPSGMSQLRIPASSHHHLVEKLEVYGQSWGESGKEVITEAHLSKLIYVQVESNRDLVNRFITIVFR